MTEGLTSEEKILCKEFAKEPLDVIMDNAFYTNHGSSDESVSATSEKKRFKKKSLKKRKKKNLKVK